MTMLISFFGFAGRIAGGLLTSALGWASSLLFGRVPRSHQVFLVLMMAGSSTWLLLVLGLMLPSTAAQFARRSSSSRPRAGRSIVVSIRPAALTVIETAAMRAAKRGGPSPAA